MNCQIINIAIFAGIIMIKALYKHKSVAIILITHIHWIPNSAIVAIKSGMIGIWEIFPFPSFVEWVLE